MEAKIPPYFTHENFWFSPLPDLWAADQFETLAQKQTVEDAHFAGKRVLIRADFNVPCKKSVIKNTARIEKTIPTLRFILDQKPKCIVLMSHLGRPGEQGPFKPQDHTLKVVADVLASDGYLKGIAPVVFVPACVGPTVEELVNNCEPGTVFLLENIRYHLEEQGKGFDAAGKKVKADPAKVALFRKGLAKLGDIFVLDAFGTAHRADSSVAGIPLPQRVAGLLVKKELEYFSKALGNPARPCLAIVGGAKVSDKILVLEKLLEKVDELIIGGGMAYTFKKVLSDMKIGKSLYDEAGVEVVKTVMAKAKERNVQIHLPFDHVTGDSLKEDAKVGEANDESGIPDDMMGLDIGPKTRAHNSEVIKRAKTIIWNGPLGVFENPKFAAGTEQAMADMVEATKAGAITIIGGGDTATAADNIKIGGVPAADQVSHVSTGGGASLELMEGKILPGVANLSNKDDLPAQDLDGCWLAIRELQAKQ